MVMCQKFGNCSISMREVIVISNLQGSDQKKNSLEGALDSRSITVKWH